MLTNDPSSMHSIALDEFELLHHTNFLHPMEASNLFDAFIQQLDWKQETIKIFGRDILSPRLQCFYGDQNVSYRYSGREFKAKPWPHALKLLRDEICALTKEPFNGVLCNLYRGGSDSMGWHSDNEPELGSNPVIASYSLGDRREMSFRRTKESKQRLKISLSHNDLLIMPAGFQHHFQHAVPKTLKKKAPRINLTFRTFQINYRKDED